MVHTHTLRMTGKNYMYVEIHIGLFNWSTCSSDGQVTLFPEENVLRNDPHDIQLADSVLLRLLQCL